MVDLCDPVDLYLHNGTTCVLITAPGDCTSVNGIYCTGTGAAPKALTCKQFYHLGILFYFYLLDPVTLTCSQTCPAGKIRSPGSNTSNSICNKDCDTSYTSVCSTLTTSQLIDLSTSIDCQTGLTKLGYNCVTSSIADTCNIIFLL